MLCFSMPAFAAYRVFELRITPVGAKGRSGPSRMVQTTLDPNQYPAYYSSGQERVEMIGSWYCPGDTSRRDLCPKPKPQKKKSQN